MFDATPVAQHRILDFDTECRPLHYSEWRPESQITAIAWSWVTGDGLVARRMLRHSDSQKRLRATEAFNLERFLLAYNAADVVTGHYIIRHDLPLLNDHCMRLLGRTLPAKLASDTKVHAPKVKGLGMSQENLATLLRLDEKKLSMNGRRWADANELTEEGIELSEKRVVDDVIQHKAMRAEMVANGWLKPPTLWRP